MLHTFSREEYDANIHDVMWRLNNLYVIVNKKKEKVIFKLNDAQRGLAEAMHTRNVIPKARQLGMSTFIQILILDSALFSDDTKCKVIAQDKDTATAIFNDKVKYAYDRLPEFIRLEHPIVKDTAQELIFSNGSSITVSTSARGGTPNILHVSEFGKIAAKDPEKAKEIITGAIPAVPIGGLIFIESTSEGADGAFAAMVNVSNRKQQEGKRLNPLDFKLHFFSWWLDPAYTIDDDSIVINKHDIAYFDRLEHVLKIKITQGMRRWYIVTREAFEMDTRVKLGGQELMYQEYPSTLEEAFQRSMEGTYYKDNFIKLRKENRITRVPYDPQYAVNTYWDIGQNDETAIWCIQHTNVADNVINYHEASGESFNYFVNWLKGLQYIYGVHYLPHDATHLRQLGLRNMTAEEMLRELTVGWSYDIVPRIPELLTGIQQTRAVFGRCWFDEVNCAEGLKRLESYRKEWDKRNACWKVTPATSRAGKADTNGADAFRMFGQAQANGSLLGSMVSQSDLEPEHHEDY